MSTLPVLGERVQATAISQIDGGMNANAAVSAARMGAQVIFAGAVGPDARSTEFLRIPFEQTASTPVGRREMRFCRRQLFSSRRTAIAQSSARTTRTMPNESGLSSPDWLLPVVWTAVPRRIPCGLPARGIAGKRKVLVIDLDGWRKQSRGTARVRSGRPRRRGRALWEGEFGIGFDQWQTLAPSTTPAVTDGSRGWTLATPDGEVTSEPAVVVDIVDAVGAGDCFGGTYIAFVDAGAHRWTPHDSPGHIGCIGRATAGPRGCPTRDELDSFHSNIDPSTLLETR